MATAESVKAKIQNLIATANEATGNADTDLTTAVNSLIAGFGTGGGASGIYMAKITPSSATTTLRVTHNLGTTDILFAALWAENSLGDITPNNGDTLASIWAKTDIPNNRGGVGNSWYGGYNATNACVGLNAPTSSSVWSEVVDENTFSFKARSGSNSKVVVGVTYTVIIMAASAFAGV